MYRLLRDPRFGFLTLGHALNGIGSWTSLIAVWDSSSAGCVVRSLMAAPPARDCTGRAASG